MTVERIVVGVDGSENAQRALAWTIDLAASLGAEVVAVHSLGMLGHLASGETVPVATHRAEIIDAFERVWCGPLDVAGVPCRRLTRDGNPVQVIIAAAEEVRADLIVLGSRGMGGFPEQLLGSTSHQVAERSHLPVAIVPPVHRLVETD